MNTHLRFNICCLPDLWARRASIVDLQEKLREHVPSELEYSCLYWASHLFQSRHQRVNVQTQSALSLFIQSHLLHWLELLSLLDRVYMVQEILQSARSWAQVGPS